MENRRTGEPAMTADADLLADLASEVGTDTFTSRRVAALLDRHVQAVGNMLARAVRSNVVIPAPEGPARLVRVREVTGGRSLWRFVPIAAPGPAQAVSRDATPDPDADLL